MNYQTFDPSPELRPFIKCFWTLEDKATTNPVKQRVIPDGCMEMIFHYRDPYRQYLEDGSSIVQPLSFIFGQVTQTLEIIPTGASGIVAARFLPEGLMPFLDIAVTELENKATSLSILFGNKGKELEQQVITAAGNKERIELIENFLLHLPMSLLATDHITRSCVNVIYQTHGQLGINELIERTNINRRNMERRFGAVVGMSPKQLSKLVRLQNALKTLGQKEFSSLTDLAYKNGYYDQAHFINEFKEFTGISPKSFFSDNLKLSALFIAAE